MTQIGNEEDDAMPIETTDWRTKKIASSEESVGVSLTACDRTAEGYSGFLASN